MRISILALGKSGSNIAASWEEYAENVYYINTHKGEMKLLPGDFYDDTVDYDKPINSKLMPHKLCIDGRGTGRSPQTGKTLAHKNYGSIERFIEHNLGEYRGLIIVLVGGGGGSGTGFSSTVCEILSNLEKNYGMIYTLPMENEGIPTIPNAINGFNELTSAMKGNKISPFFIVDNELMMQEEGEGSEFWESINERITKIMLFASLTNRDVTEVSGFNTLDEREFVRMFRLVKSNGSIGFNDLKSFPLDIKKPLDSFKDGMKEISMSFVKGYDYLSAEGLLVVVEQPENHEEDSAQLNELFDAIAKKYKGKRMLKSVVSSDEYRVNILFSGLNAPGRIQKLNDLAARLLKSGKKKRSEKVKSTPVKGFQDDFEDIDL